MIIYTWIWDTVFHYNVLSNFYEWFLCTIVWDFHGDLESIFLPFFTANDFPMKRSVILIDSTANELDSQDSSSIMSQVMDMNQHSFG